MPRGKKVRKASSTKLSKSRKKAAGPAAKRQSKETVRKHVNEGVHSDPEYAA
jgi:hypothetical protein